MALTADQGKQACERIMAHTPGPWEARWFESAPSDEIPDPSNKHSIDIVATQFSADDFGKAWVGDVHLQFTNKETAWANAKLIAAAPDMLDMLRKLCAAAPLPLADEIGALIERATK